ncbi:GM13262 [Drosophila sechellia]|uniref:GM13262 n=1 Tax=Drosophila sechellia TaxID=7238 RepID=B4HYC0_DROSE|nr:GM13262 [Drosophila sechellia]
MSMVLMGADGNTAHELRTVLNLPEDKKNVATIYDELLTKLERRKKVAILQLVNRLFVNETIGVNKRYNKLVNKHFRAEAEAINLADRSKAAWAINDWVLDQTLDNVKYILTPSDLTPDESGVMINAAFFKGYWKTRFEKKYTKPKVFYVSKSYQVNVNMMSQVGIQHLFNSSSDISVLLNQSGTRISQVVHKAFIEIDEEGGSAGSASANPIQGLSDYAASVVTFTVNSPFVFMIRDDDNIYFRGRVVNPLKKSSPNDRIII